jgi:hypothetical protein
MVVGDNFRAGLIHADTLDLVGNAEPFKQWQIEGEQRFSDVESGETTAAIHTRYAAIHTRYDIGSPT